MQTERLETPEAMWDRFIAHLELVQPLKKEKDQKEPTKHTNFIGSVKSYKAIFLAANKTGT